MKQSKRKFHLTKLLVLGACLVALLATTAFAANEITDGALGAAVLYFINGEAHEAELVDNGDGSYSFEVGGVSGRLSEGSGEVCAEGDTGEDKEVHIIIPEETVDDSSFESVPGEAENG